MSSLVFDISMSLDGYVRAADPSPESPLGSGGDALHAWIGADETSREVLERGIGSVGAVITGRANYNDSLPWWGADGPTGAARLPVIVVTHSPPESSPQDGVYQFVTTGIEDALTQAHKVAGGKDVCVMGGPTVANQFLRAGLVDELSVHVVPVLFGAGTRLTDELPTHLDLEISEQRTTPNAVHLRYKVRQR